MSVWTGSCACRVAADKLFVYGSTMPGQSRYGYIEHYVESSTPDAVEGLLYDSGQDYPLAPQRWTGARDEWIGATEGLDQIPRWDG
jgi:hypothetical protein